jgi:ABC-type transport system substrate-binding protein
LLFARDPASPDERLLREALGSSIDRASIKNVLLQGNGEPTAAILANWMSGYAFLFPSDADPAKSRQERSQVRQAPAWNISYDLNDPLSRLIVERIALNARDVGITVQPGVSNQPDIRLVTIPLSSTNGDLALMNLADTLGLPVPNITDPSPEALYEAEAALLASERIIPLFHLPADYGLSNSVKNWQLRRDGTWDLANTWLLPEKP